MENKDLVILSEQPVTVANFEVSILDDAKKEFQSIKNGEKKEGLSMIPELAEFNEIGDKMVGFFIGYTTLRLPDINNPALHNNLPAILWFSEVDVLDKKGQKTGTQIKMFAHLGRQTTDFFHNIPQKTAFSIELVKIETKGARSFKKYDIKIFS